MRVLSLGLATVIFVMVLGFASCGSPKWHDEGTVDSITQTRDLWRRSLLRAKGLDDTTPRPLTKEEFPIGKYTWHEYRADEAYWESALAYEDAKQRHEDANVPADNEPQPDDNSESRPVENTSSDSVAGEEPPEASGASSGG